MLITLIHPSFRRPRLAPKAYRQWMEASSGENQIQYILSLDNRDPLLNHYLNYTRGRDYEVLISDNHSVVDATNVAAKQAKGDVFIYMSDDFEASKGWDNQIVNFVKENNLEGKPYLLRANDNYQSQFELLTVPIMSKELYQELGYFWHPKYRSMFVDNDLFHLTEQMGVQYDARQHIHFTHQHPHNPNSTSNVDLTYKQSHSNWSQGESLFVDRCIEMGWDAKNERLMKLVEIRKNNAKLA